MDNRLLGTYLNDQLAAGVLWRETARRAQRNNDGSELGDALARVAAAVAQDVATFEQIMDLLGVRRNPVETAMAVAAERGGRLKLNGLLARAQAQRDEIEPFRRSAGVAALGGGSPADGEAGGGEAGEQRVSP